MQIKYWAKICIIKEVTNGGPLFCEGFVSEFHLVWQKSVISSSINHVISVSKRHVTMHTTWHIPHIVWFGINYHIKVLIGHQLIGEPRWLQNVQYILLANGLGNICHNPERWKKDQLKHILTPKLHDVFIQQYRAYLNDEANSDKCYLAKTCDKGLHSMNHYLSNVKSLQIRSSIAKYRLDMNNTLESKYRSFRCKTISSNLCRFCNVRQSVKHILLEFSFRNLERKREVLFWNL